MSYHVDIPTSETTDGAPSAPHFSIGTMMGGKRGRMVQVTLNGQHTQLTMNQVAELRRVLQFAERDSLLHYCRCPCGEPCPPEAPPCTPDNPCPYAQGRIDDLWERPAS